MPALLIIQFAQSLSLLLILLFLQALLSFLLRAAGFQKRGHTAVFDFHYATLAQAVGLMGP